MKRYQQFQNQQVQILLELREAQADAETERRLEHLRQVGLLWGPGVGTWWRGRACLPHRPVINLSHLLATIVHRFSNGSRRLSWMLTQLSARG